MFIDKAQLSLQLKVNNKEFNIAGGNIKFCRLEIEKEGFSGELNFWLSDESGRDELIGSFTSEQLIYLQLGIAQNSNHSNKDTLTLKALVSKHSIYEQKFSDVKGHKILYRKYQCEFFDIAQFLWGQHYPCELYTNKTMKAVIAAQQPEAIDIDIKSTILEQQKSFICLSQGATRQSFYQFIRSYLKRQGIYWRYDYIKNKYCIQDEKIAPSKNLDFLPEDEPVFELYYPSVDVASQNLLNGHSQLAKTINVKQNPLLQVIKNDWLLVTPFSDIESAEKKRQALHANPQMAKIRFTLQSVPINQLYPGVGLKLDNKAWNQTSLVCNQPYRCIKTTFEFTATRQGAPDDLNMPATQYQCHYQGLFEHQNDKSSDGDAILPSPCYVEGLIVSEPGEDQDKTYQYVQDSTTKQYQYRIHIPLWDQEIKLLFRPDFLPPHFYFPLYKGCRVLLEIDLFEARISRVLDWGSLVFQEHDNQGNQLLLGKNHKDQTSLKYEYNDSKPVFSIQRTKEKDSELMQWQEGKITIQTQEVDGD